MQGAKDLAPDCKVGGLSGNPLLPMGYVSFSVEQFSSRVIVEEFFISTGGLD